MENTIILSNYEKMLVECLIRQALISIIENDESYKEDFRAILHNLCNGTFGNQNLKIICDPNKFDDKVDSLRDILKKFRINVNKYEYNISGEDEPCDSCGCSPCGS